MVMKTYKVTLVLTIKEGNPEKWNWHEALDLHEGEEVWVTSREVGGNQCYMCEAKEGEPHCDCEDN